MKDRLLGADEVSLALSYYLEDWAKQNHLIPPGAEFSPLQDEELKCNLIDSLERAKDKLIERIPLKAGVNLEAILSHPTYLERVAEVAIERMKEGEEAPSLRISPRPLSVAETRNFLGERINFALVFGAESIYFQDTVLAFQAEEINSREDGRPEINVLGVREDWCCPAEAGGGARRSLLMEESGLVKEVSFEEPVPLHVVQVLHLPRKGEKERHKELSLFFEREGWWQINPYCSSRRADHKMLTHQLWTQYEGKAASPLSALIPASSLKGREEILKMVKHFLEKIGKRRGSIKMGIVAQPNEGTEGYKVERFEVDLGEIEEMDKENPLIKYIAGSLLPEDDALLREERGNVWFYSREEGGYRRISFRLNVAWNGREFVAESGYAQVAKDNFSFTASRGRGGKIIDIQEALTNLYYLKESRANRSSLGFPSSLSPLCSLGGRALPGEEDIERMKVAAVRAARALNRGLEERDYLKLMGIDMLLEAKERENKLELHPVLLEANPRPAGPSHSREIRGISRRKAEPRLCPGIFRAFKAFSGVI